MSIIVRFLIGVAMLIILHFISSLIDYSLIKKDFYFTKHIYRIVGMIEILITYFIISAGV